MIRTFEKLPSLDELNEIIDSVNQEYKNKENEIKILNAQIELLNYKLFGRRSEKLSRDDVLQGRLFDEIETGAEEERAPEREATVTVRSHTRRKNGRRPIPAHLPRVDEVIDLPDDEKIDKHGTKLTYIGDEISEKLDIIPAKIFVKRTIRRKYALDCKDDECDESGVKTAPMPPQIIPQGIATPGLLAYIGTSKFCDALPLYRQEKIFERFGIDMPRSTMCSWFIDISIRYNLAPLMAMELVRYPVLGIDETRIQGQKEPGKKDTTLSYMWVFRGGGERPIILYHYAPTRSSDVVKDMLAGYRGVIQTDGYTGYEYLEKQVGIIHAGCWSHGRRNFYDATKACVNADFSRAVIDVIRKIYAVEDEARERKLTYEEVAALRQEKSKPVLDTLKEMLLKRKHTIAPKIPTGKAITYVLDRWDSLCVYLYNGRIPVDNNLVENAIRPFVIGRKNWLFSGSPRGAAASATMYSLIETAKANGMEPYWYLRYLFEKLPVASSPEERSALLPNIIDLAIIDKFRKDGVS